MPKYEQLFDDIPLTVKEYVCMIGRRMTLQLCTHFMYKGLLEDQQDIVNFWSEYFCAANSRFANDVVNKLLRLSETSKIAVIHTQNLYILIRTSLLDDVPDETIPVHQCAEIEQDTMKEIIYKISHCKQNQPLVAFTHEWALNRKNKVKFALTIAFLRLKGYQFICE